MDGAKLKLLRLFQNFVEFARLFFKIDDRESGRTVSFGLNRGQRHIWEAAQRQLKKYGRVRLVVLKPRQVGVSTLFAAITAWITMLRFNWASLVVCYDRPSTENVFSKAEAHWRDLPKRLRPDRLSHTRGKQLIFNTPDKSPKLGLNSKMLVKCAKDLTGGRSWVVRLFWASEVPYWRNAERFCNATFKSMPKHGETWVLMEGTANGSDGYFYDTYTKAKQGLNDFEAIFIPFYWDEKFRMKCTKAEKEEILRTLDKEARYFGEVDLLEVHKVDVEVLKWRRWVIDNECANDLNSFHQDYPATEEEAWVSGGNMVFDGGQIKLWLDAVRGVDVPRGNLVETTAGEVIFQPSPFGFWKIHQAPNPNTEYFSAWDSAMGIKRRDFSAGLVINDKWEDVCSFHGRLSTEDFAEAIRLTGIFYGRHMVCPEYNYPGNATVQRLKMIYPNIWSRTANTGKMVEAQTELLGWLTNQKSKGELVSATKTLMTAGVLHPKDRDGLIEMLRFVETEDGKLQAQAGSHDDRVMARMICYRCCGFTAKAGAQEIIVTPRKNVTNVYKNYSQECIVRDAGDLPAIEGKTIAVGWSFDHGIGCVSAFIDAEGRVVVINEMTEEVDLLGDQTNEVFDRYLGKISNAYRDFTVVHIGDYERELVQSEANDLRRGTLKSIEDKHGVSFLRAPQSDFDRSSAVDRAMSLRLKNRPGLLISAGCTSIVDGMHGEFRAINGIPVKNRVYPIHRALQNAVYYFEQGKYRATMADDIETCNY